MSPSARLYSFLAIFVVCLASAASAPFCPARYQSQQGNPPGWPSDWGFASTGTYSDSASKKPTASVSVTYQICAGSGCGPACCWHANGFAFYASNKLSERTEEMYVPDNLEKRNSTPGDPSPYSCNVNVNFNGDSRNYAVDITLDAVNYVGVDGWMGYEGQWVDVTISCNAPVIQQFESSETWNTCGGIPAPGPICSWTPIFFMNGNYGHWSAFYVDRRCNAAENWAAYLNSNHTTELSFEKFDTCTSLLA